MSKDTMSTGTMGKKDDMGKNAMKGTMGKDSMKRNSMAKDPMSKTDSMGKEPMSK